MHTRLTLVEIYADARPVFLLVISRFLDKPWQTTAFEASLRVETLLVWSASRNGAVALIDVQACLVVWIRGHR